MISSGPYPWWLFSSILAGMCAVLGGVIVLVGY